MSSDFHKPTKLPGEMFDYLEGGEDPAQISRVAHETAQALLARARQSADSGVVDRLVAYTDEHGIDTVAELWSRAHPRSLPGALWRIYLLRLLIRQDPQGVSFLFQRGVDESPGIDPVIAGAVAPTGPDEIIELADRILRGVFQGDFAVALERAAAFCRMAGTGAASIADDLENTEPERSTELTTRSLRYSQTAGELVASARLWRNGTLD